MDTKNSFKIDFLGDKEVLRLYVPRTLKRGGYHASALTFPFWGMQERKNSPFFKETFQNNFDSRYYTITDQEDHVDYVFIPYSYWFLKKRDPKLIDLYVKKAQDLKKPILVDAIGDDMGSVAVPNSIVLRYAQYKSRLRENDVIVPVYTEDLLRSYRKEKLDVRSKSARPSIGFVGWSSLPLFTYPRTHIKDIPFRVLSAFTNRYDKYRKGVIFRIKVLKYIAKTHLVDINFITRTSFSGNKKTAEKATNILREEFVKNILDSDYSLCVRGDANQSTRFFEVLSLGRIPVFVDTDIALPLRNIIKYHDFCVWVDYRDIRSIDTIVSDFHKSVSSEDFIAMQRRARDAYQEYLRIDAFTPYLCQVLKEKAKMVE